MSDDKNNIKLEDIPKIMKLFSEELSKSQFVQDAKALSQALKEWGESEEGQEAKKNLIEFAKNVKQAEENLKNMSKPKF